MDFLTGMGISELPAGARYIADFVSAEEERELVDLLDQGAWSSELKRRVQHFGYRYDYRARAVTSDSFLGPLPGWLAAIAERLVDQNCFAAVPDQVIANEYLPGQGISAHIDCVPCFDGVIASLSLLSTCETMFRNSMSQEKQSLILEPRSTIVLAGASRYEWTHEIPSRRSDSISGVRADRTRRVSLTFRKVLQN